MKLTEVVKKNPALAQQVMARLREQDSAGGVAREGVKGHLIHPYSPSHSPSAIRFTVTGNPLSMNHLYPTGRHGKRYPSAEGVAYKAAVAANAHYAGATVLDGPVAVTIEAHFSSRRPDLDNCVKPILDALKGVCWKDDRQVVEIVARKRLDKDNPRAEVRVVELPQEAK